MTRTSYTIRRLTPPVDPGIVRQIARLHRSEIPEGFLSSLGERFLSQLYRSLIRNPDVFLFAAREGSDTLGYLCAAKSTGGVYRRFLIRHGWRLLPHLARRLCSIATVKRMLETLRYPGRTRRRGLPEPEILNFCVSSVQQRRGIGRALFTELEREMSLRGIGALRIVTGAQQHSAQRFYESIGAVRADALELHAGTESFVYVYEVVPRAARAAA